MARILVEAGATELSAARAAIVIAQGCSYDDAAAELVLACVHRSDTSEVA